MSAARSRDNTWDAPSAHLSELHVGVDEQRHQTADDRPGNDRDERTSEDLRHQTARLRPQRRPKADLPPALSDGERHERVDARHREEEDDQHHRRQDEAKHIVGRPFLPVDLIERAKLADAECGIQRPGDLPEAGLPRGAAFDPTRSVRLTG